MKAVYFTLVVLILGSGLQCTSEKKIAYDIPAYFPPERKKELLENLEKGKMLFKLNCSECHGIFGKGKDSIPNFSRQEILDYTVAFKANDRKNHAVVKKLLPEEMSMILSFLQLKKIDSVTSHHH